MQWCNQKQSKNQGCECQRILSASLFNSTQNSLPLGPRNAHKQLKTKVKIIWGGSCFLHKRFILAGFFTKWKQDYVSLSFSSLILEGKLSLLSFFWMLLFLLLHFYCFAYLMLVCFLAHKSPDTQSTLSHSALKVLSHSQAMNSFGMYCIQILTKNQ